MQYAKSILHRCIKRPAAVPMIVSLVSLRYIKLQKVINFVHVTRTQVALYTSNLHVVDVIRSFLQV